MSTGDFLNNFAAPGIIQVELSGTQNENVLENWVFIISVASVVVLFRLGWRVRSVLTIQNLKGISTQLLCYFIVLFLFGLLSLVIPIGIAAVLILQTYGSLYVVTGYGISFHPYFAITLGFVFSYYSTYFAYGEHWGRSVSNSFMNTLPMAVHQRLENLLEVPE